MIFRIDDHTPLLAHGRRSQSELACEVVWVMVQRGMNPQVAISDVAEVFYMDVRSLSSAFEAFLKRAQPVTSLKSPSKIYDNTFGDDRICQCGHTYDRHFDSYEDMMPVGCKYCDCYEFKEKTDTSQESQDT